MQKVRKKFTKILAAVYIEFYDFSLPSVGAFHSSFTVLFTIDSNKSLEFRMVSNFSNNLAKLFYYS